MKIERITRLHFTNLLSFGSHAEPVDLKALNVIIGPNGSGKTNLIEGLRLLRATVTDLGQAVREGGGVHEWIWKGTANRSPSARIEASFQAREPLTYRLEFGSGGSTFRIISEELSMAGEERPLVSRGHDGGQAVQIAGLDDDGARRWYAREIKKVGQSVLAEFKDPTRYPELSELSEFLGGIRIYRTVDWMGRRAGRVEKRDLPSDVLEEDAGNLGAVVQELQVSAYETWRHEILPRFQKLYAGTEDVMVKPTAGATQIFMKEKAFKQSVPATRWSDGMWNYLCLLTILLHPIPPPVICIEEPEVGLHPDALASVASLLQDAAQRAQLIVTTHSDALVDALSGVAESVLTCERGPEGETLLERVSADTLRQWLEEYKLGHLWRKGVIGGTLF